ncbi:MAG: ABC transporter permease [SAR86 cluster bacterium]|uniref:ABC transporter permease n=1 Tax=SAR86 cluster bacterium TaxID=2030880 RepID=A0A2A5ADX8_9GAMM|nr:MAG: ABC transporter permease [SAR86 cluster bacterium]
MSDNLREQLLLLPVYFQGHLLLTLAALSVGICISVPLGVWASQSPRVKRPLLITVSIIQTFPSLAILALVVALLGGRIGFLPAFIALTLYSMLPIVRNTVSGLESVSTSVVDAAKGIGMSPRQILTRIQMPLAMPVIVAGIRTATVWTVGLATLSTLVGASSFGNFIFTGIQTRNLVAVTVGSLASAALAVSLDGLIGLVQGLAEKQSKGIVERKHKRAGAIAGSVIVLIFLAIAYNLFQQEEADFVVGGKPFTEQYIMAGLISARLEDAGFSVELRPGLGSDVIFAATSTGNVDVYLEYSGTIWASFMKRSGNPGREAIRSAVVQFVEEQGMTNLGFPGFQNRYALAMRRDRALELGISSIEDLIPIANTLSTGGDLEFFGRSEWLRLRDLYNIDFAEKLTFDVSLMYTAVQERQVDLITAYTTDGRVAAYDLLILDDPRNAMLPYDGMLLVSDAASSSPEFLQALEPIIGGISEEQMREANRLVDVEGKSVSEAVAYLQGQL